MQINKDLLKNIYSRLGDDISKEIFMCRLMYSLTEDKKWIHEILKKNELEKEILKNLYEIVQNENAVIWGAGFWGKELYKMTFNLKWKYFIDSNPKESEIGEIKVLKADDFIKNYDNETIFISSRLYHKEIYSQLYNYGVSKDKIVNVGEVLDVLSKQQYFDLEYLPHEKEKEVFVDVGCYDGQTSIQFLRWNKADKCKIYAFEPEKNNVRKCCYNLQKENVQYEIINKGVWSKPDILHFGNPVISNMLEVDEAENIEVEVTSIDEALKDKKVTFIKMDIEGSELEALKGAEQVIRKNKPKLAICIYHKPEDIWKLPEIILSYHNDYRFYLRHYSLNITETVLYAI